MAPNPLPFSILASALLAHMASGHMVMNLPTPYSPEKASTFPITAPGAGQRFPYPCQGMTDVAFRTPVTAGSATLVNFTGAAPHGGGSCQFGINYHDTTYSTNPADWKTIYTIIGGCPADTKGNLEDPAHYRGLDPEGRPQAVHCGDDKGKDCIRQFNIPFPKGLKNGNASFAWIWYNKITAKEVYMTCAPITITGGTEEQGFVEELPQMFLANIDGYTNCTTSTTGEHGVFNIPNPGKYGVQLIEPDPAAAGNCPVAPPAPFAAAEGGSAGGNGGEGNSATIQTVPVITMSTAAAAASAAAPSTLVTSVRANPTSAAAAAGTAVATPAAAHSGSAQQGTQGGTQGTAACSGVPSGTLVCLGESAFGICTEGRAVPQQLNADQMCYGGAVMLKADMNH